MGIALAYLIYIRESGKKLFLDLFLTNGAISRKETTVNQNSQRYSYFMGLINNIYSARCVHFKQFCTLTYESFFFGNRLFGDNTPRLCFGGASFAVMVVLLVF